VVKRYARDRWTLLQCVTRFGITETHVRKILAAHDVEIRVTRAAVLVDESRVLRMYDNACALHVIASSLSTSDERVKAVLAKHGREIGRAPHPHLFNEPEEPGPNDLLRPSQAAQILGESERFLYRLSVQGEIRVADRAETGMRWYLRRDVEEFKKRLAQSDEEYRF
jgi:hypothetical protein